MTIRAFCKIIVMSLLLVPSVECIAQDNNSNYQQQSVQEQNGEKEKNKNKKDSNAEFFVIGIEKLSSSFFGRLLIDILAMLLLIGAIYYPKYRKREFLFTFFLFNITIFMITYLLNKVDLSMGAAFGLFAVFSLLRYRTEDISAKDMTYLFVVIAMGLISAVNKGTFLETAIINLIVISVAYALDGNLILRNESFKRIVYENIELIKPENELALIEDLKKRTGLNIHKVCVDRIDYLRDTATIIVYYSEDK